jgi:hypothetical protein
MRKDPQSWNGYAYTRNNPLIYVDPDGRIFRLYDANGNWQNISDENAAQWRKQDGVVFKGGKIFDKDGNQLGTYRRIWDDSASDTFNLTFYGREGLVARAGAMNKSIVAFGVGTAVIGATGGAAAYFGGVALGGSSLTTLEIGQVSGTAAVETGAAASTASTAFGRTIQSLKDSLSSGNGVWRRVAAHVEEAAGKAYKNATSIEEVFVNQQTGERVVRHIIVRGAKILHETFRTYGKFEK